MQRSPLMITLVVAGCCLVLTAPLLLAILTVASFAQPCGPTGPTAPPTPSTSPGALGAVSVAQANLKTTLSPALFGADLTTTLAGVPDLVSLNEVAHRTDAQLTRPGYGYYREPDARVRGDDGTAVLWRTDRWQPVAQGREILLDHGPQRWDHDRAATWVTLQPTDPTTSAAAPLADPSAGGSGGSVDSGDPGGPGGPGGLVGSEVSMVSVHQMINPAKYGPDRPLRQQLYLRGMQRLAALVTRLSVSGKVFVAGDFNSQHTDDDPWGPRRTLRPVGLRSAMETLGVRPTHDGGGTIDYVFYPSAETAPRTITTTNLNSDHHLLTTQFAPSSSQVLTTSKTSKATAAADLPPVHRFRTEQRRSGNPNARDTPDSSSEGGGKWTTHAADQPPDRVWSTRSGAVDLDDTQEANAQAIVALGHEKGVPAPGIVIALAVARQESGFRVYANDGLGDDLGPDQAGIATSLSLPHDAVGTDHGSLGIFQQQWPWWGPMSDLMNPATSAGLFYQALLAVPGWQSMAPGVAAQTVQRSAHPTAYDDDVAFAVDLYAVLADPGTGVASAAQNGACRPGSSTGTVTAAGTEGIVLPVPANSGAVDLRNWGGGGPHWSSWHTGTDFSVACGTPVVAANAGTVDIDTTESWAGPWLVKISRGPGDLTTWYAHMERVTVTDGQHVDAGSTLGAVGAEGNATGCHLHFEVHITGGDIYGPDNVNPSTWLEQVSAGGLSAGGLSAGGVSARGPVVAAG